MSAEAYDASAIYSLEAERAVLGCMLVHPKETVERAARELLRDDFFVPAHQDVFHVVCTMYRLREAIDASLVIQRLTDTKAMDVETALGLLADLMGGFATHLNVDGYIKIVKDKYVLRRLYHAANAMIRDIADHADTAQDVLNRANMAMERTVEIAGEDGEHAIDEALEERRFDLAKPPIRTEPTISIGGMGIAKPGDLVVISAQIKSGKSAMLGAMMAALMAQRDGDFLGITGKNPNNLPILHIDTEQSPEDYYDLMQRTLNRAGLSATPDNLYSYCLTDKSAQERKVALFRIMKRLFDQFGGLAATIADGVADLADDVNDPGESNVLVHELYSRAINYRTPLICVLHENPGTETGKTRGHLGSQLARKAASNLRLIKNDAGVIQMFTENSRRGFIAKDTGPHFMWSDEQKMHVSCPSTREQKATVRDKNKVQELYQVARDVYEGRGGLKHWELKLGIKGSEKVCDRTAADRVKAMLKFGILQYQDGLNLYVLNPHFKV